VTASLLIVDGLPIEVTRKKIKHLNLTVQPPEGRVTVSAPHRMGDGEIAEFVGSRRQWIERHRDRLRRAAPSRRVEDRLQRIWGQPHQVEIVPSTRAHASLDRRRRLVIRVPPGSDAAVRQVAVDRWLRREVAGALPRLEARWAPALGVEVATWTIRRMSTRWGTCNPEAGRITLNLELATEPPEYLEYVVVHEMVHLREPGHGVRFQRLMDRHLPDWRKLRTALNRTAPGGR
jgi:hypothetical protein